MIKKVLSKISIKILFIFLLFGFESSVCAYSASEPFPALYPISVHVDTGITIPKGLTPSEQAKYIGTEFDRLELGQLQYGYNENMVRGESYEFKVFITGNIAAELNIALKELKIAVFDTIHVSPKMGVSLYDPNFDVKPADPFEQSIDSDYTQWQFAVKPLKGGDQYLNLVVYAIIELPDNTTKRKNIEVTRKLIKVTVHWYEWTAEFLQTMPGFIAIGTIIVAYIRYKRKIHSFIAKRWKKLTARLNHSSR